MRATSSWSTSAARAFARILEDRRAANDGAADPLPLDWAFANVVDILPALGYLHDQGLAFCDFKPDNVMQTPSSLKLIDLGGVYRMGDGDTPIYGTKGFQAPEISRTGPTVASDLYTVGRALAVLCTDFQGHQSAYQYSLPAQGDVPLYAAQDSLYRFLERATATNPDERFQSAEEMRAQLLGILREVRAAATGAPKPGPSTLFTPEGRGSTSEPDWRALPTPLVSADDPAAAFIASIGAVEPEELIETLRAAPEQSDEIDLWQARTLLEVERVAEALDVLERVEESSPWEWRTLWYRGVSALVAGEPVRAAEPMRLVYRLSPGELAPKLALGLCSELADDFADAARWYEIVLRTDPGFTSAAFGLARCRIELDDRAGAVAACEQVPATSSAHVDAQVAAAEILLGDAADEPELSDVLRSGTIIERANLDKEQRARLSAQVLEASLGLVGRGGLDGAGAVVGAGAPTDRRGHPPRSRVDLPPAGAPRRDDARADRSGRPGQPSATEDAPVNLHEELRCARCGTPSLADDEFCEACGAPLGVSLEHDRIELDAGSAGGVSDRGRVHRRNEDALFVHSSDDGVAVVVCDGVSMSAAPHVASAVAADVAGEALVAALRDGSGSGDRSAAIEGAVQAALKAVLDVPWTASPGDVLSSPACTLVAAVWDGHEVVTIGWAGDSRAYWLGAGGPNLLTVDHSWAQEQVAAGVMTVEAAEADRRAHAITRWLGADAPEDIPQVVTFRPAGAGRLLLCSDGLWNYASTADELAELAATAPDQTPISVARALTDIAVERGGRDNITVAVVEVRPTSDGPGGGEEA